MKKKRFAQKKDMLYNIDFIRELFDEIELHLTKFQEKKGIEVLDHSYDLDEIQFDWLFKTQNFSLPHKVEGSTEIIKIFKEHYQINVNHLKNEHPKLINKSIEETVNSRFEDDNHERTILSAIKSKIMNLIYQYNTVLKVTKEVDNLFGIKDEEKILINHLNLYEKIYRSENKQIKFFHGITLNKEISDLILKTYIRFIKLRLDSLNPKVEIIKDIPIRNKSSKVVWKGNQKELCELFVELQKKGWIEEIGYGKISQTANAICNLFDLTHTQKDIQSDTQNSFYQILKGRNNAKTKKREYDDVFGKSYKFKFVFIKENEI